VQGCLRAHYTLCLSTPAPQPGGSLSPICFASHRALSQLTSPCDSNRVALAGWWRRLWAGSGCGGSGRAPGWCGWAVASLLRRFCGGAVCWRPASVVSGRPLRSRAVAGVSLHVCVGLGPVLASHAPSPPAAAAAAWRGRGRVPIAGWSCGGVGPERGLRGGGRRGRYEEWARRG
jgi:hypothetical protein